MDPNSLKTMGAAAGAAGGGDPIYIDNVFSCHLYDGTGTSSGSAQSIVNGIDLAGEGGLVVSKVRNQGYHWGWTDTERGVNKYLSTNDAGAEEQPSGNDQGITAFNNNGFTCGLDHVPGIVNYGSGSRYVSYTFRKQKKFFDIVTYTGTGANRTIPHGLGSVPGMIIIKQLNATGDWYVYHRKSHTDPGDRTLYLNTVNGAQSSPTAYNGTQPTDSVFSVGTLGDTNGLNDTFVAYLFAHEEAAFGPNLDQEIISCGSYTGNTSTLPTVNLGWEPQVVMIKNATDEGEDWMIYDSMRGISHGGSAIKLMVNDNGQESTSSTFFHLTSTGFQITSPSNNAINKNSSTYVYLAIRAAVGNMITPPDAGTKVFAMDVGSGSSTIPNWDSTFPVDFGIMKDPSANASWYASTRLIYGKEQKIDNTPGSEGTWAYAVFDSMAGWQNFSGHNSDDQSWMWRRHAGFDVVGYTGTGSATTVNHSLGQAPKMIWVKSRGGSDDWQVYHFGANGGTNPSHYRLRLNTTDGEDDNAAFWNDTAPTSSVFSVGTATEVNDSSVNYLALLFSNVDNISKVGYYDGTGSTKTITTNFAPRFVMIKSTSSGAWSNWYVYDTHRGIPTGNDNYLMFNKNDDEEGGDDIIDVDGTSFTINVDWASHNSSSHSYIYYAHA